MGKKSKANQRENEQTKGKNQQTNKKNEQANGQNKQTNGQNECKAWCSIHVQLILIRQRATNGETNFIYKLNLR